MTTMPRLYGRCEVGEGAFDRLPQGAIGACANRAQPKRTRPFRLSSTTLA